MGCGAQKYPSPGRGDINVARRAYVAPSGAFVFSRSRSHGLAAIAARAVGYYITPLPGLKNLLLDVLALRAARPPSALAAPHPCVPRERLQQL